MGGNNKRITFAEYYHFFFHPYMARYYPNVFTGETLRTLRSIPSGLSDVQEEINSTTRKSNIAVKAAIVEEDPVTLPNFSNVLSKSDDVIEMKDVEVEKLKTVAV